MRNSWNPTVAQLITVSWIRRLQGDTPLILHKHALPFFAFTHAGSGTMSREDASMAGCHFATTCLKIGPSLDSDASSPKQKVYFPASPSASGSHGCASSNKASLAFGTQPHRLFFCSPTDDHRGEHHDVRGVSTSARSTVTSALSHHIVPSVRQKGQNCGKPKRFSSQGFEVACW